MISHPVLDNSMIQPSTMKTNVMLTVRLECLAEVVEWYFNELRSSRTYSNNPLLTLSNVQQKNGGYYYCYGKYDDKDKHFVAKSTVEVTNIYGELKKHSLNKFNKTGE